MNRQQCDLLKILYSEPYTNQRTLSKKSGYSLGFVNKSLKQLAQAGLLDRYYELTPLAKDILQSNRPKNAIILAAGYGMRMIPINLQVPKALLEVRKQPLIERTINY